MKVVSNSGPLIALGKLGQLGLLLKLYQEVLIPREVYHEVVVNGLRLGALDASSVEFLVKQNQVQIIDVTLPVPWPDWAQPIDIGEAAAIWLAHQQSVDWILVDNAHARQAARQIGLPVRGTVGVLLQSFRQKHLSLLEFELLMENIKQQPDLWISAELCNQVLAQARREAR